MNAQDLMLGSRVAHLRELKTQLERARAENAALRAENAELRAHLDLALLAAEDLRRLPPGGRMRIWDGWNLILGAGRVARDRAALVAEAEAHLAAYPLDFVWIVLDGPRESVRASDRLRVSYTGGVGAHRADKLICDFVRMARFRGVADRIDVRTDDKDFRKTVVRLLREAQADRVAGVRVGSKGDGKMNGAKIIHLDDAAAKAALGERFAAAFAFLGRADLASLPTGRYEIDGERVYATIAENDLKPVGAMQRPEFHRRYADIQAPLTGEELFGLPDLPEVVEKGPFDAEKDIAFFDAPCPVRPVRPGECLVIPPCVAHAPCLTDAPGTRVRKAIVKVLWETV